ncbi:MAG: FlgD immunoglobulin-like domain containing protein, partial [bacterium]
WGTDVQVDDDTVSFNCYPPDVFVQPGTNHYLVVADAPVRQGSQIVLHSHFYKSTDMGRNFSPGFQLDTFSAYCRQPHIVADEGHIITDYTGGVTGSNQCITMARTYFVDGDTWGEQVLITELDTTCSSYTNGARLAIDRQGGVHTALMIAERQNTIWNIYYTNSTDFGVSWQEREPVSLMPSVQQWDPSIAVDHNCCAYIVWQDMRSGKAEIWFSTNRLTGIAESEAKGITGIGRCYPFVFKERTAINISGVNRPSSISIFNQSGRRVRMLNDGVMLRSEYSFIWDGRDEKNQQVPEGVYYLWVEADRKYLAGKVIRVK